jgi:radical SAM superfamily enzyme YgiQ (UPF0313 family)
MSGATKKVCIIFTGGGMDHTYNTRIVPWLAIYMIACSRHRGYAVEYFDDRIDRDAQEKMLETGRDALAMVFLVRRGHHMRRGLELAESFKRRYPHIPRIFTDYFPSIAAKIVVKEPLVDIVLRGHDPWLLPHVMDRIHAGISLAGLAGVVYRENGSIIGLNAIPPVWNEEWVPRMAHRNVDMSKYINAQGAVQYVSSVGCRSACGFCANSYLYRGKWFSLPVEQVVEDIVDIFTTYNPSTLQFWDNDFFTDLDRVRQICQGIIDSGLTISWHAFGRVSEVLTFDDRLLELLARSGFKLMKMGGESGSPEQLKLYKKPNLASYMIPVAEKLKAWGINSRFIFVLGAPYENERKFEATMGLIMKLRKISDELEFVFYLYSPIIGTKLGEYALSALPRYPETFRDVLDYGLYGTNLEELRMPWIQPGYERLIKRCNLFYFPLAFYYWQYQGRNGDMRHKILNIFRKLAVIRVAHNMYRFPWEWYIFKALGKKTPHTSVP